MTVLRYATAVILILIVLGGTFLSGFLIGESKEKQSATPDLIEPPTEPADREGIDPFPVDSLRAQPDLNLAKIPKRPSWGARRTSPVKPALEGGTKRSSKRQPGPVKKKLSQLSPPGLPGALNGLLEALNDNPSSYQVEVIWDDPLSGLEVHFEYRRDTQMLTKWDGALWEQWRGVKIRDIYTAMEYGYPLTRLGNYTYAYLNPTVTEALRTR